VNKWLKMSQMPLIQSWWRDPVFSSAVGVAGILHVMVLMLQFGFPQEQLSSTKDIAVSLRLSQEELQHADFLAQADQQGSGQFREAHRMSSDSPVPMQDQQVAGEEAPQQGQAQLQKKQQLSFEEKVLMTTLSWQKQAEENERKKRQEQLNSQFQAKAAMVASLEAQYMQRQKNFSRQQKIKTVDGIHAKQDVSAAYLEKFRQKVEFYGNRFYPESARLQHLAGEVRLMVILNQKGGIRAIRLLESSGYEVLDEAAKMSLRKAAPFGAFDVKMNDISELRIIRTWRFDPAEAEFEVR